jgi:hypothetical protein
VDIKQTQEMFEDARSTHAKAMVKMYKLLTNILSGNPQTLWDWICHKMHERDLWTGVNGQMTTGKHLHLCIASLDCLKLHKLTVFTADAAERQRYYI